jgi:malate dehydrogenase (oxaloacetate-decarboxylating)
VLRNGSSIRVDQTNNAYVFPGIGLGSIAARARRISDNMLMAAARALASLSPSKTNPKANLLPPVTDLREVSYYVGLAVALEAQKDGLAERSDKGELASLIRAKMWTPVYRAYHRTHN